MKELIGLTTVILSIVGHTPYIINVYKRKTQPHLFTWLIWSIVVSVAFFGQWVEGGGAVSWSTGITSIMVIIIAVFAIRNPSKDITVSDKILFALALVAIGLWYVTKTPMLSVILATIIDGLAFIPTIRKTIKAPKSETLTTFAVNIVRHSLSLVALQTYNLTTMLYPTYLLFANMLITSIMVRGKQTSK